MNNKLIDSAMIAYQSGDEAAFSTLWQDWLAPYLNTFVTNAGSDPVGMDREELASLANAVAAYACRTWKPGAGACFKTWLCRLWRQRLANAVVANRRCNATGRRRTSSLDQLNEEDGSELYERVADPTGVSISDHVAVPATFVVGQ